MMGWRARIGFLVPPGNPTVEPEMAALTPPGVSVHFTRMDAGNATVTGTHTGQDERNRRQIASVDECVSLLAPLAPKVIVLAHTATSYTLGAEAEAALVERQESRSGTRFITAFGSVLAALAHLNARSVAYATPYGEDVTAQGKAHLERHGIAVPGVARLEDCRNIYEENYERAYQVARRADRADADAVFLSGVGMPTLGALQMLENDLGKPVFSAASAMMWYALQVAGVRHSQPGYGRLLAG